MNVPVPKDSDSLELGCSLEYVLLKVFPVMSNTEPSLRSTGFFDNNLCEHPSTTTCLKFPPAASLQI